MWPRPAALMGALFGEIEPGAEGVFGVVGAAPVRGAVYYLHCPV